MVKIPQAAGSAFVTRNGNWFNRAAAAGPVWKGGGRPAPKKIAKGAGLGGRRAPPSIRKQIAQADTGTRSQFEAAKAAQKGKGVTT